MGEAKQYQAEVPSQDPPSGSQGPHWVPEAHPPAATPLAEDQHSPPMLTWAEMELRRPKKKPRDSILLRIPRTLR